MFSAIKRNRFHQPTELHEASHVVQERNLPITQDTKDNVKKKKKKKRLKLYVWIIIQNEIIGVWNVQKPWERKKLPKIT